MEKRIHFAVIFLLIYLGIDAIEVLGIHEIGSILIFVRAIAISISLYLFTLSIKKIWNIGRLAGRMHDLLVESSRFSLQLYLFNGYLLAVFRMLICYVLHINIPIVIVLGILIGDVAVTLFICKKVVVREPILRFLCGIRQW